MNGSTFRGSNSAFSCLVSPLWGSTFKWRNLFLNPGKQTGRYKAISSCKKWQKNHLERNNPKTQFSFPEALNIVLVD